MWDYVAAFIGLGVGFGLLMALMGYPIKIFINFFNLV